MPQLDGPSLSALSKARGARRRQIVVLRRSPQSKTSLTDQRHPLGLRSIHPFAALSDTGFYTMSQQSIDFGSREKLACQRCPRAINSSLLRFFCHPCECCWRRPMLPETSRVTPVLTVLTGRHTVLSRWRNCVVILQDPRLWVYTPLNIYRSQRPPNTRYACKYCETHNILP